LPHGLATSTYPVGPPVSESMRITRPGPRRTAEAVAAIGGGDVNGAIINREPLRVVAGIAMTTLGMLTGGALDLDGTLTPRMVKPMQTCSP
jgi:hypothetical protein